MTLLSGPETTAIVALLQRPSSVILILISACITNFALAIRENVGEIVVSADLLPS